MIESDIGKRNAQKLMISITIVQFVWISGYGTLCCEFSYVVSI